MRSHHLLPVCSASAPPLVEPSADCDGRWRCGLPDARRRAAAPRVLSQSAASAPCWFHAARHGTDRRESLPCPMKRVFVGNARYSGWEASGSGEGSRLQADGMASWQVRGARRGAERREVRLRIRTGVAPECRGQHMPPHSRTGPVVRCPRRRRVRVICDARGSANRHTEELPS